MIEVTEEEKAALDRLHRYHGGELLESVYSGRAATEDGRVHLLNCDLSNVAAIALREHPADDDERVTEEWLSSIGVSDNAIPLLHDDERDELRLLGINHWYDGIEWWNMHDDGENCGVLLFERNPLRRGDVRRLCRALGIEIGANKR